MSIFLMLLKREYILYRHNWFRNIISWFLFPIIIFVCIAIPLYKIIPYQTLDYLHWAMPGIWIVTSSIVCAKVGLSRNSELYNKNSSLHSILQSPMSLWKIITAYFIVAAVFGIIQLIFSVFVLAFINQGSYSFYQFVIILLQITSMIIFISGISGTLGFLAQGEQTTTIILLILFSILSFGFGGLIPINLFPEELSSIILIIPMVNIIQNTQNILLLQTVYYWGAVITFILGILFLIINIIIGYKLLRN